jgi:methylenetetrahydrofolate reductase (NADPH)
MTRISIELTPRSVDSLVTDLRLVKARLPSADMINIPDLLRMPIRSWEGCRVAKQFYRCTIPHIRAMDLDLHAPLPMAEYLRTHSINEVLIVTGDRPQELTHRIYPTSNLEAISKFKKELPDVCVYATLDPYRQGIRAERDLAQRKLDAGADGFFTQPMFDLRLFGAYAELTDPAKTFWGVSPVLSERSMNYWETTNNVVFPRAFQPTMAWNRALAGLLLQQIRSLNSNIYFMPIKADIVEYLGGVL